MKQLKEIYAYRDMVYEMTKRELRGRYQRSVLGVAWNFLNPLFQIMIYWVIFTFIFPNGAIADYPVYLATGLIPWSFFSESLTTGTAAITANGDMVKKIYFPREVLVISSVLAKFVNLLLSFVIIFLFILLSGRAFPARALPFLIPVLLTELVLTMGMALILSSIDVYLRDMEYIINIIIMAWVWATPIMYDIYALQPVVQRVLLFNPMTRVIMAYHSILYDGTAPDAAGLGIAALTGIVVFIIGEMVFHRLERGFAEEI